MGIDEPLNSGNADDKASVAGIGGTPSGHHPLTGHPATGAKDGTPRRFQAHGLLLIGLGVRDFRNTGGWYAERFGLNRVVAEDTGAAGVAGHLTAGIVRTRHAAMIFRLAGGTALEVWQGLQPPSAQRASEAQIGDLGIFALKIGAQGKPSRHVAVKDPTNAPYAWECDPEGNRAQVFHTSGKSGFFGAVIGVEDVAPVLRLLADIFGTIQVVFDQTGRHQDFSGLPGGDRRMRRVIVAVCPTTQGVLPRYLGRFEIELLSLEKGSADRIFADRMWGDCGFFQLGFSVGGSEELLAFLERRKWQVVARSSPGFSMGDSKGRFFYVEPTQEIRFKLVEVGGLSSVSSSLLSSKFLARLPGLAISAILRLASKSFSSSQ